MSRIRHIQFAAAILAVALPVTGAAAQCAFYDFEQFADGTAITTQLNGVTFYTVGNSCGGSPTIYMRVQTNWYSETFSSKVLIIDTGCPDFSDDYLKMVFQDPQSEVSFSLGPWGAGYTYHVRAYDAISGGTLVSSQDITIPGTGFVDVKHQVTVTRAARDIRRIEVEASGSGWEAIDNLRFGRDDTPPTVQIDYPSPQACVTGQITLTGIVCDDDGAYDRDRLETMRAWPNPETNWTLVREYVGSPVCTPFSLYAWDTTAVSDGVYVLRVTAINACGMATNEAITVYVDNQFDSLDLRSPASGAVLGGGICFDGTAWDRTCFDHYVVQYKPVGSGVWSPVDSANPTYTTPVINDPLASWVDSQSLPDGDYYVALAGYTTTGATMSEQIAVTLDNTMPIAEIVAPTACTRISGKVDFVGTALDANLESWELQYWSPTSLAWVNIQTGTSAVSNDVLGTWDTSALAPCYYAVRLRVWDSAILNNCDDIAHHRSDYYLTVAVGDPCPGDVDGDGDVDISDLGTLLAMFGTVCQ